jgi:citrate lyase beta subunit
MNVERLRRSLLFVPASEPHRIAEGAACEADGVFELDGHFVDAVHVRIARRIVRQAELVAAVKRRGGR